MCGEVNGDARATRLGIRTESAVEFSATTEASPAPDTDPLIPPQPAHRPSTVHPSYRNLPPFPGCPHGWRHAPAPSHEPDTPTRPSDPVCRAVLCANRPRAAPPKPGSALRFSVRPILPTYCMCARSLPPRTPALASIRWPARFCLVRGRWAPATPHAAIKITNFPVLCPIRLSRSRLVAFRRVT